MVIFSGCSFPADKADIVAAISYHRPDYDAITLSRIGTHRGETVFAGEAKIREDFYREIDYHEGGEMCGVSWWEFNQARGDQPTLRRIAKAGAPVTFTGEVLFREPKPGEPGWVSPSGLTPGVWGFKSEINGVKACWAGDPVSKIKNFNNAIFEGSPEFEALCARAKTIEKSQVK